MKKFKINSIGYGGKILVLIGVFLLLIPSLLLALQYFFYLPIIHALIRVSLIIGAIIVALFVLLLMVEFSQDRRINRYYASHTNMKIQLSDGRYECQSCGNTRLKASDRQCGICGVKFVE